MNKILEDQINLYLLGRLLPEDKAIFEKNMQNNPEFKKEVLLQQEIAEALQYKKILETKATVKNLAQNWEQYVPELNETKPNFIETAQQSIDNLVEDLNKLVLQVFIPYSTAFRNTAVDKLSREEQAFFHYNKKDFAKAITLLIKLPKEDQEIILMTGNAYLAQQDYKNAYPYFKQLIDDNAVFFLSDAHWYAGLCLTGLNWVAEAQKHFQYLINNENTDKEMQQNAQTLLHRLNQQ